MKSILLVVILALTTSACARLQSHEKLALEQAQQAGLVTVSKPQFDSTFRLPAADFSRYKRVVVGDLDFSQTKIIGPSRQGTFDAPWVLTDDDKRYYQERFTESVKRSLSDAGVLILAEEGGPDTLLLKTRITEIAPHASKDDAKGRPNITRVYSEGFGRMTIVFELYDSVNQQLVMLATDQHDLGRTWEVNNRAQNNRQVRLAFDYWLSELERELRAATKK